MAFVGREEIRAPLKTHEGEASVAKAAKIKMKKYWLENINKITKKLSQELCQTNPGRGYCLFVLTWKRRHLHAEYVSS